MSLRFLALVLVFLAALAGAALPAFASSSAEHTKAAKHDAKATEKGKPGHSDEDASKPKDGLFSSQDNLVPLPTVIAPVLVGDRLSAHLYLFLAALTETAEDAQQVKMRLPYVQDAMVRAVYQDVLAVAAPGEAPDTTALLARLKDVINGAVGQALVTELQVGRIDMAPY